MMRYVGACLHSEGMRTVINHTVQELLYICTSTALETLEQEFRDRARPTSGLPPVLLSCRNVKSCVVVLSRALVPLRKPSDIELKNVFSICRPRLRLRPARAPQMQ